MNYKESEVGEWISGELVSRCKSEIHLKNARRLWYWEGAASLSQLAMEGVKSPDSCKFPTEVNEVILYGAEEILKLTKAAVYSINSVKNWSA
jgi:hypothetical protein